uniref:DnaJ homolog subfamily C member 16 n=1 Tax=Zeugodacus cucurbitae TaxID=28588 RepID=A0A0A1WEY5_ZEUCU
MCRNIKFILLLFSGLLLFVFVVSSSDNADPYEILGIVNRATAQDIRRAYKHLVRIWYGSTFLFVSGQTFLYCCWSRKGVAHLLPFCRLAECFPHKLSLPWTSVCLYKCCSSLHKGHNHCEDFAFSL